MILCGTFCLPRAAAGRSGGPAGVEVVGDVDDAAHDAAGEGGEGGAGVDQRRRRGGGRLGRTDSGRLWWVKAINGCPSRSKIVNKVRKEGGQTALPSFLVPG